ncbi:MAG: leucine-rich repeat domain-containing protein [Bacteroidales bacterium]|nr:leucine-rich repeat domain-containing protein [Bacteroidales bacterium]
MGANAQKAVNFSQNELTNTDVRRALDTAGISDALDSWIAHLESTVHTLKSEYGSIGGSTETFDYSGDYRCAYLVAVTGGENLTTIGANSFSGCRNLASVSFPAITQMGDGTFLNCNRLTSVSLGTGFTSVIDINFVGEVFKYLTTENIALTLGTNVDVSGADTDIASNLYKGYIWKSITISNTAAIGDVLADGRTITGYYSILGQPLADEPASGLFIVTYDDGTSEKRMK